MIINPNGQGNKAVEEVPVKKTKKQLAAEAAAAEAEVAKAEENAEQK